MTIENAVESLEDFVEKTRERETQSAAFANETPRTLRVELDGSVWIKPGAAIGYHGEVCFERLQTLGARSVGEAVTREAAPLVRASGRGRLYCAHGGAHVRVLTLAGDAIVVVSRDLLAFEASLDFEARLLEGGVGLASGGMVVMRLSGDGAVAFTTHGRPLTLKVSPGRPICTDPHATLAWSSGLEPTLKTDIGWRSAIAHGGQEPVQMHFEGSGFVVVQPFEEPGLLDLGPHPLRKVASLISGSSLA